MNVTKHNVEEHSVFASHDGKDVRVFFFTKLILLRRERFRMPARWNASLSADLSAVPVECIFVSEL